MLQAITPVFQNVIRNPNVQKAGFAILCGVGTFYTIRTTEGARKSVSSWFTAKREAMAARRVEKAMNSVAKTEEKAAAEAPVAEAPAAEAPAPEAPVVVASVATPEVAPEPSPVVENSSLEEAIKVIMEGASFNQLRTKAKELGLKFEGNPTKAVLARALAEQAAAAPAA